MLFQLFIFCVFLLNSCNIRFVLLFSACPVDFDLPKIAANLPITCHVPDYCTGIECCVEVDFLKKSFHFYILLDGCRYKIKAGIEDFGIDETLYTFDSG